MTALRIEIDPFERGIYRGQWDAVVSDLEQDGISAGEVGNPAFEERAGQLSQGDWIVSGLVDLVVLFARDLDEEARGAIVAAIVLAIQRRLRGVVRVGKRKGQARVVKIRDEHGDVLAEVEVPADEDVA